MNNISKNKFFVLFILIIVFVSLRLSLLFFTFNKCWSEEGVRGIAAKHILEGNKTQPVFDYFQPYQGGSVIVTLITVPFFYFFGVSTISLRLTPLLLGVLILISFFLFMDRFFKRKIAVLASLLYIFPPLLYSQYSSYCIGNHHFVLFFYVLILFVFFETFSCKDYYIDHVRYRYFILLGFISGLAFYACFSSVIILFSVLLFWYIFDKSFFTRKQFFVFLIFFVVGISPLFYYMISNWNLMLKDPWYNPFYYLRIESYAFNKIDVAELLLKIPSLFIRGLTNSFNFDFFGHYPQRRIWNYFYYIVVVASFLHLIWTRRNSIGKIIKGMLPSNRYNISLAEIKPCSFLIVLTLIFMLLSLFSEWTNKQLFQPRYLFTLYPGMFIFLALAIVDWFNGGMFKRIISLILGGALILIVIISNLSLIGKKDDLSVNIYKVIPFLRTQQIKYIYTYYIHKWPIAFESKEDIIPSGEYIWDCDPKKTRIFDDNLTGERYFEYEKLVDRSVDEGRRYAYSFLKSDPFGHYLMLEDYLAENKIQYKKVSIEPGFLIYYDFSKIVKPRDVDFKKRWKEKNNIK